MGPFTESPEKLEEKKRVKERKRNREGERKLEGGGREEGRRRKEASSKTHFLIASSPQQAMLPFPKDLQ